MYTKIKKIAGLLLFFVSAQVWAEKDKEFRNQIQEHRSVLYIERNVNIFN